MINEKKLREKLKWLIHPFRHSGSVPADLVDKIVTAVQECEVAEEPETTEEAEEVAEKGLPP